MLTKFWRLGIVALVGMDGIQSKELFFDYGRADVLCLSVSVGMVGRRDCVGGLTSFYVAFSVSIYRLVI
jgi:hypothetical protein